MRPYFNGVLRALVITLCILVVGNIPLAFAQDSQTTLTGWLNTVIGDPMPGSGLPAEYRVLLSDGQGGLLAELDIDFELAQAYQGQQVTITGQHDIQAVQPLAENTPLGAQALTGSQRWVNVLCRFPDVVGEPHLPADYAVLFGSAYPGLDHYFRQLSYNNINLAGTVTTSAWYTMPQPRAYYLPGGSVNLTALARDCAAAADASVHFPSYVGINFMFNADLGCCAWGGNTTLSIDGQTRGYRATWMPPWGQIYDTLAHEMGHGFGFPHSTGPANNPPSSFSVYVSEWDVMSSVGGTCIVRDEEFYIYPICIPQGTIAYHLDLNGWIPPSRRVVVNPGQKATVTLEQLHKPSLNTNALIIRIPVKGSSTLFYTVEARALVFDDENYDQNIPDSAVIIHLVNTARSFQDGRALVVDGDGNGDVNDAGATWLPGETFVDAARGISIAVLSATPTSFTVRVRNHLPEDTSPRLNASTNGSYAMTWNQVDWAVGYEIQVDTETSFTAPYYAHNPNLLSGDLSFNVTNAPDGLYYWRVRAKRSDGSWGAWSAAQSFEVVRP